MSDRDDLAALIRKANQDARDADAENGYRCGFDSDRFVADAILAAGWQPSMGAASVSLRPGLVTFTDKDGNAVTQELTTPTHDITCELVRPRSLPSSCTCGALTR